jgi:hypothetical protein
MAPRIRLHVGAGPGLLIWGAQPLSAGIPDFLRGIVILNQPFPLYRLFLIALGISLPLSLLPSRWELRLLGSNIWVSGL